MIYVIGNVDTWSIRSKKSRICETQSLRNYNKAKFLYDLKEVNWEQMLSPSFDSLNLMVAILHKFFDGLLNAKHLFRERRLEINLHRILHHR